MLNSNNSNLYSKQNNGSGASVNLHSPTKLDKASHFLWNDKMLVQVNCQGYVNAQFMQPEPSKYSKGPNIEATTFMQPEMPYYADHPGRFIFIKDEVTQEVFSIPYAPMKAELDRFQFGCHSHQVVWQIEHLGLSIHWRLTLPQQDVAEVWQLSIKNSRPEQRKLSVYSSFSLGFMSWMNQSAAFDDKTNTIIAKAITPYQKVEDYFVHQHFKEMTFLHANRAPDAWCANMQEFVGHSGIHAPAELSQALLSNTESCYEMPVAAMQFRLELEEAESDEIEFLFAPAKSQQEIENLVATYSGKYKSTLAQYQQKQDMKQGEFEFVTGDCVFDDFVNHWLPRQAVYHAELNRLTTDPQTRNFLQDTMALLYFSPEQARERLILAMSQQQPSGQMPDGILLNDKASLKYINQVPHADHCVWLVLSVKAYLDETADHSLLDELVCFADGVQKARVATHIELAIEWLLSATNEEGLSYIEQGDWCDPMNMVGYKGKGVSSWLTIATCYAMKSWLAICDQYLPDSLQIKEYRASLTLLKSTITKHFKVGNWYARGITDDGRTFGTIEDEQGQIFLNPQSWALLADIVAESDIDLLCKEVMQRLATSYGMTMLAPAFTHMHEDIGRVTQKYPGSAENGSVYNHAAAFWAFAMFEQGKAEQGFDVLRRMLACTETSKVTGQLPTYIPNYYRGARAHSPEHLGRSSHLFNTGTVAWYLKSLFEGLAGFKPSVNGVTIEPVIPANMKTFSYKRKFRGAEFHVTVKQTNLLEQQQTFVNGTLCDGSQLRQIEKGMIYQVDIRLPWQSEQQGSLIVITGVSGSGKSSVAEAVAQQLGYVYMEADEFHSRNARAKMARGEALSNSDRMPWIARMKAHLKMLQANEQNVVLAYSGLKQAHRAEFTDLSFHSQFFHLDVSKEVLESRLANRAEHFFDKNLLTSQLSGFEPYQAESVEIINGEASISVLADTIVSRVKNEQ